jgi:hypothetical protein
MLKRVCISFILFFIFFTHLLAQSSIEDILHKQFTTKDGLTSNLISDANFDNNGFLWILTQAGLSRFDGQVFINYSSNNTPFIKLNRFNLIDKVGSELLIVNEANQLFTVDSNSKLKILNNFKYRKDFIISTNRKVVFFNKKFKLIENEIDSLERKRYFFYWINKNAYYHIFNNEIVFNGNFKLPTLNHKKDINFTFVANGKLYVINSNKELLVINKTEIEKVYDLEKELKLKLDLTKLWTNFNDNVISFNYENKLFLIKESNNRLVFDLVNYNFDSNNQLTILDVDPKINQTFVFSKINGFYQFTPTYFNTISLSQYNFLKYKDVYRVLTNRNSEVFNSLFTKLPTFNEFGLWFNKSNDTICYMYNDDIINIVNNRIIENKLQNIELGNLKEYTDRVEFDNKVFIIQGNKVKKFKTPNELEIFIHSKINYITTICKMINQNKWLLGSKKQGIHVHDLESKSVINLSFFDDKEVRQIKYDSNINKYWIFTYGAGIYLLDNNLKIVPFYSDENKFLNFAHYYLQDTLGFYWIPSNNGLFQIHINEVIAYVKNKNYLIDFKYFNTINGLENNEFNGRYTNSGIILPNGHLAFSNMAGIVTVNPYILPRSINDNPIIIDEVVLNNKNVDVNYTYTLTEGFKDFHISVSSPNFNLSNQPHLEYQIPAINDNWNKVKNQKLSLFSLKSGTYQILFRKIGDRNKLNYKLITLKVNPPWFATKVAYLIYSLLFLSGGYLLSNYISKLKQKKVKNELVLLESELKALRSQINPHYLSNSLMSLQSVVLDNDKEKAFEFIGQYGKVMRSILEKSDFSFIPLVQELQTLSEYTKLEGLIRNVNITFEYQFYSDNPIANLNNIKVPTMIFQPFVENSILHGLMPNKNEFKQIQFKIRKVEKKLEVIITDNGIGFVKKSSERRSYGLENVQNRLKAYSKLLKVDAYFKIETINNESGLVSGTKVTISMPYLFESENPII